MVPESMAESTRKRLKRIFSTLEFCMKELGVRLALKVTFYNFCIHVYEPFLPVGL